MRDTEKNRAGQKPEKMTWAVLFAIEREVEIEADNLNEAVKMANYEKTFKERIVSIRLQR